MIHKMMDTQSRFISEPPFRWYYLNLTREWISEEIEITGLTFAGHHALEAIRNPAVHQKAKHEWLSKVRDGLISASTAQFVSLAMGILQNANP